MSGDAFILVIGVVIFGFMAWAVMESMGPGDE